MIRHIHLRHWRAYDELDLDLTHPVTFLVAPNGVGKTSLVEAVRFGMLGSRGDRTRGRAVKAGEDSAEVLLIIALAADSQVEVVRTLRRSGAETFNATIDGRTVTEDEYVVALTRAWGADPPMLDSVIFGPAPSTKSTGFPIKDHLAEVFGISPLLEAADEVQRRQKDLSTQISALRHDLSDSDDAISLAAQEVVRLRAEAEQASKVQQDAAAAWAALKSTADEARTWDKFRSETEAYEVRTRDLLDQLADLSGSTATTGAAESLLGNLQHDASVALASAVDAAGKAELSSLRARKASEFLQDADDTCPTCLRPLSEHERENAQAAHGATAATSTNEVARLQEEANQFRTQLARVADISRAFAQVHPPVVPSHPDPGRVAVENADAAARRANEAAVAAGAAQERAAAADRHLSTLRSDAADQERLKDLARQEALLSLTHDSLVKLADRYLHEQVEPLATEIGHRWKVMFGRDGLQLGSDGELTVERADVNLLLSDLSGGERATALLVTRLMLAASVTRTTTLWLDEPLEHLDPRRRVGVAQALVQAVQAGTVSQVLITTYEETIARRLVATSPDLVSMTNARTAGDQLV